MDLSTDFGRTRYLRPQQVVTATRREDILTAFDLARKLDAPITVRASGHSCNGQTLSDGVVVYNRLETTEIKFLGDGLVQIPARSTWRAVETALNRHGLKAPVITDYLATTVGGTLSVGGIGLNSIVNGFQIDNVARLELLRPVQGPTWCSPSEHPDLFRAALGGLGQVGVIESVVIQAHPYKRFCHTVKRAHPSLRHLLDTLPPLTEPGSGVDHLHGYFRGENYFTEFGYYSDSPQTDRKRYPEAWLGKNPEWSVVADLPFAMHDKRDLWLNAFQDHFRVWVDYVFDYENFCAFLADFEPLLESEPLNQSARGISILLARRRPDAVPFILAPTPPGEMLYGFGSYFMLSRWNPHQLTRTVAALNQALELCARHHGRPYLYGAHPMEQVLKLGFFNEGLPLLRRLRTESCGGLRLNPIGLDGP